MYNAGAGTFGTVTEITPDPYEADWRVNAFGAFVAAKEVAPALIARGHGTMLFTGAIAGVKAGPKSVSFGPAKFAMRGLAQSLVRDLGPRGIHVAWINVDGSIDIPGGRELKPRVKNADFLKPDANVHRLLKEHQTHKSLIHLNSIACAVHFLQDLHPRWFPG